MPLHLLPTINKMIDLYEKPRSMERFQEYLKLLQGDTRDDLAFPIGNFNPMAKEHVLEKLKLLRMLKAEAIIEETLAGIDLPIKEEIHVALNLADDLKGAWTNHYTTDYDSKFKLNALLKRNFCTVLLWTSEEHTPDLVEQRTREAVYRNAYRLTYPQPLTLEEHIEQERFVAKYCSLEPDSLFQFPDAEAFYLKHRKTEEYHIIFNFLYGDEACRSLGFPALGVTQERCGYRFAAVTAK
jgi:hypothetical protein